MFDEDSRARTISDGAFHHGLLVVPTEVNVNGAPALQGSDGNVYVPDPENPGEYLGDSPKADLLVQIGGLDLRAGDVVVGPHSSAQPDAQQTDS